MLESKHCCCAYCKTDSRCSEKRMNGQITRGSFKAAVTSGQMPKPSCFRNWMSRTVSERLRLADHNTSLGNVLQRNLSAVYRGFDEKTYQLTHCQKFPNLTTRAVRSNEYDTTVGQTIIQETIPNS